MQYKVGDVVRILDSDTTVTIKIVEPEFDMYVVGSISDYEYSDANIPKHTFVCGAAVCIKEKHIKPALYQVGDTVWILSLNKPRRIEKACIEKVDKGGQFYQVRERDNLWLLSDSEIYPTKEALLAAINPPPSFVVGQTVYYLEKLPDRHTIYIHKDTIESIRPDFDGDYITFKNWSNYKPVTLDTVFATPDEAFAKAKEVQGW